MENTRNLVVGWYYNCVSVVMTPILNTRVLIFAASLRKASYNKKLALQAAKWLRQTPGVEVGLADFREFEMPVYDGDLEERSGIPPGGIALIERVRASQAVVLSTPEYNGGIPGILKNAIDWSSRVDEIPFAGKPILLLGASPGSLGAIRGLWHSRVPFEAIGAYVYPEMFGLAKANHAFDELGNLIDSKIEMRLQALLQSYLTFVLGLAVHK